MESKFKTQVLWKIYLIWFFKRILPLLVLEILLIAGATYFFARFIFVEKVVSNALVAAGQNPLLIFSYLWSAFLDTAFFKQAIIVVLLGIGVLLLRDLGRALASYRTTSRAVTKR